MTDKKELYRIADFILNKADEGDLEVVSEALKKRLAARSKGPGGIDINYLAHSMGDNISKQVSASKEQLRETIAEFVARSIRQQVPDISDEHLEVLLKEWVTDPGKKERNTDKKLPHDVELKMIDQFLRFSSGKMPLEEQSRLRESIPDWQQAYWQRFTRKIRGLLTLYLKGRIDSETCWREIQKELFDEQQDEQ